jgi:DNA-binding NtrC family response regulator
MSGNLASSQSSSQHAPQASPRHTILVVEDECLVRMDVANEFHRQGFRVLEAQDADKARDLLQSEAIDLLFTDIQLPGGMDGLALAKLVHATRPEIKVIIASGSVQMEGSPKMADAFFSKPYDFVRIVAVIRKLLADRDPRLASAKRRNSVACAKAAAPVIWRL